jgi:hypothetical protein
MNVIVKTVAVVPVSLLAAGANCLEILPSADSSMHTEGHGPVTIVFETGLGDTGNVWRSVQTSVADHCARTVSNKRRGYGIGSNAIDGPPDARSKGSMRAESCRLESAATLLDMSGRQSLIT